MAASPNTEHRARLIGEMSRDLSHNRSLRSPSPAADMSTGTSTQSSKEIADSTFDPDNEALLSTNRVETTNPLPDLRSSARRFGRYKPSQAEPRVNTSLTSRTFPDFSQNGSSDEGDMSVEQGRGAKRDQQTPTVPLPARATRFGSSKLRQVSAVSNAVTHTPQKSNKSATNSAAVPGTATQQSFILPDLPNLTELVSGKWKDGTPLFSRTSKAKSRFTSANSPRRSRSDYQNHAQIESIPLPPDEKAIIASLQLLRERVAELELQKSESDHRAEEYENEVSELKTKLEGYEKTRRSDSALGSTDGEADRNGANWRFVKSRLESTVQTLQNRLDRSERKVSVSEVAVRRITQERDSLATQLSVAYCDNEDLKNENESLRKENELLRQEVDALRDDNDRLRSSKESLKRSHLRTRTQRDEPSGTGAPKTTETSEQLARLTQERLQADRERLQARLAETLARQEEDAPRWMTREAERRTRDETREETTPQSKGMAVQELNKRLRNENEDLKKQLARLSVQRDDETQPLDCKQAELKRRLEEASAEHEAEAVKWAKKEAKLRAKVNRREEAVRQLQDLTKELRSSQPGPSTRKNGLGQNEDRTQENMRSRTAGELDDKSNVNGLSTARSSKSNKVDGRQAQEKRGPQFSRATSRLLSSVEADKSAQIPLSRRAKTEDFAVIESDLESTTDLEMSKTAGPSGYGTRVAGFATGNEKSSQPATADITYLSFMDENDIARLRKTLEEERAAERRARNDHAPTQSSVPSQGPQLLRKSSLKDVKAVTEEKEHADSFASHKECQDEAAPFHANAKSEEPASQRKEDTLNSILSNVSRRRRSAPTEMTSAFILPDITLGSQAKRQASFGCENPCHDSKMCTICDPTAPIPEPLPAAAHPVPDGTDPADMTIRPAQSPPLALATVLKNISDELAHLKLELASKEAAYHAHDPAIGQRKRRALHHRIQELLRAVETRSEILYKLYDVLEGMPRDSKMPSQKDVEETMANLGLDAKGKAKGSQEKKKSVVIRSPSTGMFMSSEDDDSDFDPKDDAQDLPWEGLSETESMILGYHHRNPSSAY